MYAEPRAIPAPPIDGLVRPMLSIRPLEARDASLVLAHFLRLDADTRRLRFGTPVNDDFLRRYAAGVSADDASLFGLFDGEVLRGVAELRPLHEPRTAEGAFSLERSYQGLGHGTALFDALLKAAKAQGVGRLVLNCLGENIRMQRIARRFSADLMFRAGEVVAEIGQRLFGGAPVAA